MGEVADGRVNTVAIGRRSPLNSAKEAARAHLGCPQNIAIFRIKGPVDPTLLPGANNVDAMTALGDGEEIRSRTKIKVGAGRVWARNAGIRFEETRDCPGIGALQPPAPFNVAI